MKFWPENATKPGPLACGYDWVVIFVVVIVFMAIIIGSHI